MNTYKGKMMFFDKAKKGAIFVLACMPLVFVGCARGLNYRCRANQQYSICAVKTASQRKMVENFNKEENQLGGENTIFPAEATTIAMDYQKEDALARRGVSLGLSVSLESNESAYWQTQLSRLDVSQAKALSLWLKTDDPMMLEGVSVLLTDVHGNYAKLPVMHYMLLPAEKDEWFEVLVPRKFFASVDCNKLDNLRVTVTAGTFPIDGSMSIDEVVFTGEKKLYFYSLQDNLFGFPQNIVNDKGKKSVLAKSDRELVENIARDTWKYFENIVDKNSHLPLNVVKVDRPEWIGDYTSPTDIGLYLISCVGAFELKLINEQETKRRIEQCLMTLEQLPGWKGFLFNYYNTTTLKPTSSFVSTVDCAWLAAGLIVIRQTFDDEIGERATGLLNRMNFQELYDSEVGQLRLGYDNDKKELSRYHYGLIATESRIASLIAIGKGDVDREHWFRIYRTLPKEWTWQAQTPQGDVKEYFGYSVFQGYYTFGEHKIVPSWGGSLFEFLMPTLVIDEKKLSPHAFKLNNKAATEIHIDYALNEKKYKAWGISPCSVPGRPYAEYEEFGIKAIGAQGYKSNGVITPHVTYLALDIMPDEALANIRTLLTEYDIYGDYGIYDSVNVRSGKVSKKYLALDQGMIFISCVNYLKGNVLRKRFHNDPIMQSVEYLLGVERFFE